MRVRFAAVDFADDGADVLPQAGDGRARQHGFFGDGKAEAGGGFGLYVRRECFQARVVFCEQVEAGQAVKVLFLRVRRQFADGL